MHTLVPVDAAVLERMAAMEARGEAGLTPHAFAQFTRALSRTTWGHGHVRPVALVDGPSRILASALLYRLPGVVDEQPTTICAVGDVVAYDAVAAEAVVASLVAEVVQQAPRLSDGATLVTVVARPSSLVPDGFAVVPTTEATLHVTEDARRGAPMAPVRSGHRDDLPFLVDVPRLGGHAARLRLARDVEFFDFALVRQRLLAGLAPAGARQLWFLVVEEGMRAAAYVVIGVAGDDWMIEACGDRDPSGARVGAILQALVAREPAERRPTVRAWLPPGFAPPQVTISAAQPSRERLCVRVLEGGPALDALVADEVAYWHGDLM